MENNDERQPKSDVFFFLITVMAVIVLALQRFSDFSGMKEAGFVLFTIFCIGLAYLSRKSKLKLLAAIGYFGFGVLQMI